MRRRALEGIGNRRMMAAAALVLILACARDPDDRRAVLETAQRANYEIARDTVVQLMRSPRDPGRLVYDEPTNLSERRAASSGAEQVWAPFGIAQPDTVAAGAVRSRTRTDTAAPGTTRPAARIDTSATRISR